MSPSHTDATHPGFDRPARRAKSIILAVLSLGTVLAMVPQGAIAGGGGGEGGGHYDTGHESR